MLCCHLSCQEARKGHPVPDGKGVHPRHAGGRGSLPAAEEGPEQADDRRIPGQSAEAVQPGRFGVSHFFFTFFIQFSQVALMSLSVSSCGQLCG